MPRSTPLTRSLRTRGLQCATWPLGMGGDRPSWKRIDDSGPDRCGSTLDRRRSRRPGTDQPHSGSRTISEDVPHAEAAGREHRRARADPGHRGGDRPRRRRCPSDDRRALAAAALLAPDQAATRSTLVSALLHRPARPRRDLRQADHRPRSARVRRTSSRRRSSTRSAARPGRARATATSSAPTALGRDVFSRTLYGARVSLAVAFISTCLTVLIGVTLGIIAGYYRGWADTALSRSWTSCSRSRCCCWRSASARRARSEGLRDQGRRRSAAIIVGDRGRRRARRSSARPCSQLRGRRGFTRHHGAARSLLAPGLARRSCFVAGA